jgi:hypothetical protein
MARKRGKEDEKSADEGRRKRQKAGTPADTNVEVLPVRNLEANTENRSQVTPTTLHNLMCLVKVRWEKAHTEKTETTGKIHCIIHTILETKYN